MTKNATQQAMAIVHHAVRTAATLESAGIAVRATGGRMVIEGNTYPYRGIVKSFGFKWDGRRWAYKGPMSAVDGVEEALCRAVAS